MSVSGIDSMTAYLKEANVEDSEKEWLFLQGMSADEAWPSDRYSGMTREYFEETVLPSIIMHSRGEGLEEGRVPETTLFLWDGDEIVGQFRIRHHLNDALRSGAGHIGYYIREDRRGRGYASEGLRQALALARDIIAEDEIYFRVRNGNAPSLRVILKNGGYVVSRNEQNVYLRIGKRMVERRTGFDLCYCIQRATASAMVVHQRMPVFGSVSDQISRTAKPLDSARSRSDPCVMSV